MLLKNDLNVTTCDDLILDRDFAADYGLGLTESLGNKESLGLFEGHGLTEIQERKSC